MLTTPVITHGMNVLVAVAVEHVTLPQALVLTLIVAKQTQNTIRARVTIHVIVPKLTIVLLVAAVYKNTTAAAAIVMMIGLIVALTAVLTVNVIRILQRHVLMMMVV